MEDESRRVLAHYLQGVATGRLREDLAEDCKLRWYTGRSARNPETINEFMRFHIGPQYTHADFAAREQPCNPHKTAELAKRYNLMRNPSGAPNKRRHARNLNYVPHNEPLRNQPESEIEDARQIATGASPSIDAAIAAESSLCEDEHHQQQIERTPPPSTRKQTNTPAAATQIIGCNADEITQTQTQPQRCLHAFGELRRNTNELVAAPETTTTVDAIVKVRLVLFYRLCLLTSTPEFVFIFYERNEDDGRCHLPPARLNLYARLQTTADDGNEDNVDDDNNDELHAQNGHDYTPPPSATATPAWVMTPSSVTSASGCDSVSNTSTSRKRQHESDSRTVLNKRKAMRRLRL